MALTTHICSQLLEKATAFAQMTLDDDYIVRDNKPDVLRVIYTFGSIQPEDIKAGNGNAWITGKLCFHVLYQSDDENHRLESISGEIPFQEKIVMDDLEDGDEVFAEVQLEDLSVGIINSRKLVVRAVLNVTAKSLQERDEAVACGAPEEYGYQQKTRSLPLLSVVTNKKDVVRISKEMLLPNARSNVGTILFYQVDLRNQEVILQEEKALVQMDAQVMVLYRSESTGDYECYETTVPLSGELELPMIEGDEIFWAKMTPLEMLVEPRSDYDGEARMLGLELSLGVEIQVYREYECDVLEDAYSLEKELHLQRKTFWANQLLMKNLSKVRLMEQVQLEPNRERILQICGCSGKVTIDRVQRREDGILVEGILNVHILYNTTEDAMPYAHNSSQLAFEQFVEMQGVDEDTIIRMDTQVEQLQVNLLDNMEYEAKAILQIGVLAMRKIPIENIVSIEEEELDLETLQKQAGMIGYIRGENEDLWDIAKRYHATAENILEVGNKVLVIKQV